MPRYHFRAGDATIRLTADVTAPDRPTAVARLRQRLAESVVLAFDLSGFPEGDTIAIRVEPTAITQTHITTTQFPPTTAELSERLQHVLRPPRPDRAVGVYHGSRCFLCRRLGRGGPTVPKFPIAEIWPDAPADADPWQTIATMNVEDFRVGEINSHLLCNRHFEAVTQIDLAFAGHRADLEREEFRHDGRP